MNKRVIVIFLCVLVALVAVFVALSNHSSYSKAFENTKKLKDYTMNISTIVSVSDGDRAMQSAVDQVVKVKNKGKEDMEYSVFSNSTTTDENKKVITEQSGYLYSDRVFYYAYPGVKYQSTTDYSIACDNIEKLSGIIMFEEEKIHSVEKTEDGISFQVDYENVSDYVKTLVQSAAEQFDNVSFSFEGVEATATIKDDYITEQSFIVEYSASDKRITIEIYTALTEKTAEIEEIKKEEYVKIN